MWALMVDGDFERRVREAATFGIPHRLARAIWLVDVCGSTYSSGAAEVGVSEPEFARRVSRARRAIRALCANRDADDRPMAPRSVESSLGSFRRWASTVVLAVVPIMSLVSCGGDTSVDARDVGHIHDLVEHDGELLLATHQGLFRLNGAELQSVGDEVHDLMSAAVLPNGDLVASGHPDLRMEKYRVEGSPSHLGLIRSADSGENWEIVDLLGQVDFHALALSGDTLFGGASSGMIWEFVDGGTSQAHALGGIEQDLRDIAASPETEGVLITTSFDGRVAATDDAAQTWEFLTSIPEFVEVEWSTAQITAVDLDGGIWAATDVVGPYRPLGQAPDVVDALLVDSQGEIWLATHDGSIWTSTDGSGWDLVRAGSP